MTTLSPGQVLAAIAIFFALVAIGGFFLVKWLHSVADRNERTSNDKA